VLRTVDVQRKREARHVSSERNFEAFCRQERLEDVAHNVYLVFFVLLELLPDDRIVEHVEFVSTELALQVQRLAVIDNEHLAL